MLPTTDEGSNEGANEEENDEENEGANEGGGNDFYDVGDDDDNPASSGCESDLVLELQQRISEYEAEIRSLRAKLESQKLLMEQLQSDALMSFEMPRKVTVGAGFPDHPLLVAADAGDAAMVALLLEKGGADPAVHSNAALLLACQNGHVEVAEMLLQRGADVHVDYDSPLLWAAQRGDTAMTRVLLTKGASPDRLDCCALRLATKLGHVDVVNALLEAGVKLRSPTRRKHAHV
jgi:hypothetical protein